MNKTEKRMKIFTLIMQVIIQAVLLFPWMNMGTWKCNVPGYLIKLATSGDGMSYIKKSLKPLGVLDGADEQMMVQILMLFICELVMVLVIQVIGIVNLILALSNHHKLLLDIMSLIAGCMISFLGADGAVFSDPLSQVYPFLLVVLLVINLIGAKLIDSWQEEKKIQEEVKAREKNYKEEKKKHLEFSGKYPKGFYTALWKNFKSSKRDFIVYVSMKLLPATLIFSGVGMAQMLAPFNKEGNILTGHGITAILLEFLIVSLIASLMLMITNLLSYFRKRMRNYSIFSTLGMRKSTLYEVLGAEIVAGILGMLIGGACIGSVILCIIRRIFMARSGVGAQPAKITGFTYLIASLILIGISGIGLMILRDFFLYRELKKMQLGDVEKEKMPEKRIGLWLTIGLVIVVFGIVNFGMRKNAEGLRILLFIFLGIYLAEKFGFGLFLKVRKHKKSYYAKLIPYNSFYYRFKSTFRYVYVISLIPVVQLEDGSIANLEIQKIGYYFPGERSACYSADLLLRQYKRVRGIKGKRFSYRDIKQVYTIVLFEKSPTEFQKFSNNYIHRFMQKSDTGVNINLLQEYLFIPLDIFKKNQQNENRSVKIENRLEAWLAFFCMDDPETIIDIIEKYPDFKEMYEQAYDVCRNIEEVMQMFSKELLELDRNTVKLMIDDMQKEIDCQREQLSQKDKEMLEMRKEIQRLQQLLDKK